MLQDCWSHHIEFIGEEQSQTLPAGLKILSAVGCAPLEDCGGMFGWDELRKTWDPNTDRASVKARMQWARMVSPLAEAFDPFASPNIDHLNCPEVFQRFNALLLANEQDYDVRSWFNVFLILRFTSLSSGLCLTHG